MVLFVEGFTSVDESAVEAVTSFCSPNPASNVINIENPSGAKIESVSLYDISGRLVKKQHSDLGTIDISSFAPGVYILKLSLENGSVFEEKIIKQ
ncbi:MAG: T9SS type A sorting domain-containing protein [Bacteroidales bacterium]|nr:T9SS type A sorting domain-containing protein [Bacteroidales bacterium]